MRDRTARTEAQLRQRLHCQAERADASASVGGHAEEDKAELDAEPDDSTGKDKADKSQRFKRASGLFRKDRLARPFRSQDSSLSSRDSDVGAAFPAPPGGTHTAALQIQLSHLATSPSTTPSLVASETFRSDPPTTTNSPRGK